MDIVFFINTPFHAHLYRNAIEILKREDNNVFTFARDCGCTLDILEYYGIEYIDYGKVPDKNSIFRSIPSHYKNIFLNIIDVGPDVIFGIGGGGYSVPAGILTQTPVITFWSGEAGETVHSKTFKLQKYIFKPFRHAVISPDSDSTELSKQHYHITDPLEFAYLHQKSFSHSQNYFNHNKKKILLRFNSFSASHDVGISGFSDEQRNELILYLHKYGEITVTDEMDNTNFNNSAIEKFEFFDSHPAELHKEIANSDIIISDGQSVIREGAVAGTPGIRYNSFVGMTDEGLFTSLEDEGLILNTRSFQKVKQEAHNILTKDHKQDQFIDRHKKYTSDATNVTDLIVKIANNHDKIDKLDGLTKIN